MAFVRWRGNSAQLLATVYDQGRSRQILLANLHGAYATTASVRKTVAEQFPEVVIDWHAVDRALATGPLRQCRQVPRNSSGLRWRRGYRIGPWIARRDFLPSVRPCRPLLRC